MNFKRPRAEIVEPGASEQMDRPGLMVIAVLLAVVFALQGYLAITKSINWDEFFHFQHLLEFRDHSSDRVLQTAYLRPLTWLLDLPLDSISQLIAGRLVMLLCELATALAIYGIARQFADRLTAAFCVLAYLTAGYVFLHGFAFRADPPTTAMLMGAAWLMIARPLRMIEIVLLAMMLALATLFTIKAVFYAPVFLGIGWLRFDRDGRQLAYLWRCAGVAVLAGLIFAGLFLIYGSTLTKAPVAVGEASVVSSWNAVFAGGLLPQGEWLLRQITRAPIAMAMLVAAPFFWRLRFTSRAVQIAMAGFALPMLTVLFYANSYPYYFVFIMAPAAISLIPVIEWLIGRYGHRFLAFALVAGAAALALIEPRAVLGDQRRINAAVHQMFPQPVTYVDFCGMVGDFPRALPFLISRWGLNDYRRAGQPVLTQAMEKAPVPLLIVNHDSLGAALGGRSDAETLLPADSAALRDNFVPHWGPVWVTGKQVAAASASHQVTILVPGIYTIEGAGIGIDGQRYAVGDVVTLARGEHLIHPDPARAAILRWGNHLPVPQGLLQAGYIFTNY